MTDLSPIVGALLADDEWHTEWFGGELITRATPYLCLGIVEGGPPKSTDAKKRIIASSPVWLAQLVVGWIEEKEQVYYLQDRRNFGREATRKALRDFNLAPEKFAELKKRLEDSLQSGQQDVL